jgi:ribosomal protein L24
MGLFSKGDKVTVTTGDAKGKTGIVVDDGSKSGGEIAVKGIDGRLKEAVLGYRGYTADDLKKR